MAAPFGKLWAVDGEFTRDDRHPGPVKPICLCAVEIISGRTIRVWEDELGGMKVPPFSIGPDSCLISYAAGAEAMLFAALGWSRPAAVLDLFAEYALRRNAMRPKDLQASPARPLGEAMQFYGLPFMDTEEKAYWRGLAINPPDIWTRELQGGMLDYCARDTDDDRLLYLAMERAGDIDWPRAVWRGCASFEFGIIEHHGMPLRATQYHDIMGNRHALMQVLIRRLKLEALYPGGHFNYRAFSNYLAEHKIPWPRFTDTGEFEVKLKTLQQMAKVYPQIGPIAELQATKLLLDRKSDFPIGPDNRTRHWCHPYGTTTSRNRASGRDNILAGPAWLRALIDPARGTVIVIIDYSAQEVAIAGGLSGDLNMIADYSGDFHFSVAIAVGLAAGDETGAARKRVRNRVKPISLGTLYGRTAYGIAAALGVSLPEAEDMLALHRKRYATYWRWVEHTVWMALSNRRITAPLGWSMEVRGFSKKAGGQMKPAKVRERSLMNWMMQTVGAEMLRAAVVMLGRAGFKILTTAHDSVIFEIPLATLDADIARAREIMERVSLPFTRGVRVKTEATSIRPGEPLVEEKAKEIWPLILELTRELAIVPEREQEEVL